MPGDPSKPFENEAMKKAAATWSSARVVEARRQRLGGTRSCTTCRPNLLIYGTGNGTPWNQMARDPKGGDNLYVASIVALDADTGEYKWHYQATPGDTWDYDSVSPMMTADLPIGGEQKHVLIQPEPRTASSTC